MTWTLKKPQRKSVEAADAGFGSFRIGQRGQGHRGKLTEKTGFADLEW